MIAQSMPWSPAANTDSPTVSGLVFALVMLQLMVMPEVLIAENYLGVARLGLVDHVLGIALPYVSSAFGIFLLRQAFKTVPKELEEAARIEGCGTLGILWRVYVPLARPTYIAYGLVLVSFHWNNFLWPLVITNSITVRPITVGLAMFSTTDQGTNWGIITAATLLSTAPLVVAFLLFQRQFVQSFMRTARSYLCSGPKAGPVMLAQAGIHETQ